MTRFCARRTGRRLRSCAGQSLIEAAIVTPFLLLLTFAIIDFAVLFYVYLALESGVSQATRYGVTGNVMPGMSRTESIKTAMRQATPNIALDDSNFAFSHLAGGSWVSGTGGPGDIEKLTINYRHNVILLMPLFTNGGIDIRVESSMKNERRFE
jgi:Flp pilus assembly protein TadG